MNTTATNVLTKKKWHRRCGSIADQQFSGYFYVENFFFLHVQIICFVCLFCCFTSQVNSYGHGGAVSSPNHTFSWASLSKQLTTLSLVTRMIQRKGRLLHHPLSRIVLPVYEVGEAV